MKFYLVATAVISSLPGILARLEGNYDREGAEYDREGAKYDLEEDRGEYFLDGDEYPVHLVDGEYENNEFGDVSTLVDLQERDPTAPITPSEASALEDRPPLTKDGPQLELGRFSVDDIDFHFDKNSGGVFVENESSYLRAPNKNVYEDNIQSLDYKDVFESKMYRRNNATVKGNAPRHLPVHAGAPDIKPGVSVGSVFGNDDRKVFRDNSYPYSTVGRVSSGCTGTMVGPRHVLTAAHCLSSGSMTFTPSYYDGYAPFGTANVLNRLHWNKVNLADGFFDDEVAFDYAVLVLDQKLGDRTGWMATKVFSDSWIGEAYWSNIGYPGELTGTRRPVYTSGGVVWTTTDYTYNGVNSKLLGHFIDIEGGHSGGPLYAYFNGENYPAVIGVQSSESKNPSYSAGGDNQAGGGQGMVDLVKYARDRYP